MTSVALTTAVMESRFFTPRSSVRRVITDSLTLSRKRTYGGVGEDIAELYFVDGPVKRFRALSVMKPPHAGAAPGLWPINRRSQSG